MHSFNACVLRTAQKIAVRGCVTVLYMLVSFLDGRHTNMRYPTRDPRGNQELINECMDGWMDGWMDGSMHN